MDVQTDGFNIITTRSSEAAALYRSGLGLLVVASPDAGRVLRAAVCADEQLAVGLAALAVEAASHGADTEARKALASAITAVRHATRRERQHVEILSLFLRIPVPRAPALAAAHLLEFPDDLLVAHLFRPT